jgi:peptidoglycan/LPS O-acetylase OafA/YrhL
MKQQKYPSINGLRAVSICLVIISHLALQYNIFSNISHIVWLQPFIYFSSNGQLGVDVFFVISGFLITTLLLQEEENTQTISLKNFYIRRTLRIFPAYFFLLFVYFILQSFHYIHINRDSWITALTYTKYFNWQSDWYTSHAWSLSIEEHFYIIWPFFFIAGDKIRKVFTIFLICIVPVIRTYIYLFPVTWISELSIFIRIDSIAVGCLFALYRDPILNVVRPHFTKLFYVSIILLFFSRYFPKAADLVHLKCLFIPLGLKDGTGTIANILIAIIMMYSIFGNKGIWYKLLNLRFMNYLGILSYSIYLWQQPFIRNTDYWVNQMPQNLFFIFAAALFSYYLIEKPFLKLKSRFSVSKKNTIQP